MSMGWLALLSIQSWLGAGLAIGPNDVFILANQTMPESLRVAEQYCQRRSVPREHLIALPLPKGEDISRADYDKLLRQPLLERLAPHRSQVKVLLTVYGVPLRVGPQQPTPAELEAVKPMEEELKTIDDQIRQAQAQVNKIKQEGGADLAAAEQALRRQIARKHYLMEQIPARKHEQSTASVDSELSLLWWGNYPTSKWLINPLHRQFPQARKAGMPPVVMVSRLDGPTPELCIRLIEDAIAAEKAGGPQGNVYLDSRFLYYEAKQDPAGTGYNAYDESIRELSTLIKNETKLPMTLHNHPNVFPAGACVDAALYCGWYSPGEYYPIGNLVQGSIAVHIASYEAISLRDPKAKYWCKNLLEAGAAVTMGPVAEPYLFAFPRPAEFFGLLLTGQYTMVECYYQTSLVNSWMMTLIGDPLYNPFRDSPHRIPEAKVVPSPKGSTLRFQ